MPNMYDNMEFPEYSFKEFPRHVYLDAAGQPTGQTHAKGKPLKSVIVASQDEYDAMVSGDADMSEGRVRTDADDRRELYAEAERIKAMDGLDKRWATARIAKYIEDYKAKIATPPRLSPPYIAAHCARKRSFSGLSISRSLGSLTRTGGIALFFSSA